ncbi:hypothetical protein DRQ18_04380 [bacterium]|nr:MAG: hypothetical protein DRQ18_04380 [bacterium]
MGRKTGLFLLLLLSCSRKEFNNPYDPINWPGPPVLISPVGVVKYNPPEFRWKSDSVATSFILTVSSTRNFTDTLLSTTIPAIRILKTSYIPSCIFQGDLDTLYWRLKAVNDEGYGNESDTFFLLNHRLYPLGRYDGYFMGSDGNVYGYGWDTGWILRIDRMEGFPPSGVNLCNLWYEEKGKVLPSGDTLSVVFWSDSLVLVFRVYFPDIRIDTFKFEFPETSGVKEAVPVYPHHVGVVFYDGSMTLYDLHTLEPVFSVSDMYGNGIKNGGIYDSLFLFLKKDTLYYFNTQDSSIYFYPRCLWFSPSEKKGVIFWEDRAVIYSFEDVTYPEEIGSVECIECIEDTACVAGDFLLAGGGFTGLRVYSIKGDSLLMGAHIWKVPDFTVEYKNGVFLSSYYLSFPAER